MVRKYFGKVLTVQSVKKLLNKFHIISFYSGILDQHSFVSRSRIENWGVFQTFCRATSVSLLEFTSVDPPVKVEAVFSTLLKKCKLVCNYNYNYKYKK